MWQSSTWNGQEAAFRFYLTVLAVRVDSGTKCNGLSEADLDVFAKLAE
jgi:hypothetical protein